MFFKLVGLVGGGFPPENRSGVSENQSVSQKINLDSQKIYLDGQKVGLDSQKAARRAQQTGRKPQKPARVNSRQVKKSIYRPGHGLVLLYLSIDRSIDLSIYLIYDLLSRRH